jgi:microfibrillar-associated protein 1
MAGIVVASSDTGARNSSASAGRKVELKLDASTSAAARKAHATEPQDESSEYETDSDEGRPIFRRPGAPAAGTAQAPASESSKYETDSEDEEDAPPPLVKPIFVPKRARTTLGEAAEEAEGRAEDAKAEEEATRRRKEAHELAAAAIQRQLAEQAHEEVRPDVDDTDGLDPDGEFEAWRARELARLQRDRDADAARRAEAAETARIRTLPEHEREQLGRARARQLAAEKKSRAAPAFLQKYYHKGSFFQDDPTLQHLQRDYAQKTSKEVDVSKLPKIMQVRNYGAKGRSKWTHLANEDTSKARLDLFTEPRHRSQGFSNRAHAESSGANCAPLGIRQPPERVPTSTSGHTASPPLDRETHSDTGRKRSCHDDSP